MSSSDKILIFEQNFIAIMLILFIRIFFGTGTILGLISIMPAYGQISEKIFTIGSDDVKVTHKVEEAFYGKYEGDKSGYLQLNSDGTGIYEYDIFGFEQPGCKKGKIDMEWGFLVDENNQIVKFIRDYGFSYPIIYSCTGSSCFQGCSRTYLVDFILDKNDGRLLISSSDDWEKSK